MKIAIYGKSYQNYLNKNVHQLVQRIEQGRI